MNLPGAKLPHVTLPTIRSIPTIPHVGCAGAQATTYVGQQHGNAPDIGAVRAMKALKKSLDEQIYALFQGMLPDGARPPVYQARALQLVNEVAEVVTTINQVIAEVTEETSAAITATNAKIGEMNAAKSALENIPEGARSKVQQLMAQRYARYAGELTAQAGRLQSTIDCVAS
jgi:methyl-accepting chemotaxis protein